MAQHPLALTLGNVSVRQQGGLFSLNDLHKASGGEKRHQPGYFLVNDQAKGLVTEISTAGIPVLNTINGGPNRGTYACRELVIAYAAWISPSFHLRVIRVFLGVAAPVVPAVELPPAPALLPSPVSNIAVLDATAIYKAVAQAHRAAGLSAPLARQLADDLTYQQTGIHLLPPATTSTQIEKSQTDRILRLISQASRMCDLSRPANQALLRKGIMPHSKLLKLSKLSARELHAILESAIADQLIKKLEINGATAYVKA